MSRPINCPESYITNNNMYYIGWIGYVDIFRSRPREGGKKTTKS